MLGTPTVTGISLTPISTLKRTEVSLWSGVMPMGRSRIRRYLGVRGLDGQISATQMNVSGAGTRDVPGSGNS